MMLIIPCAVIAQSQTDTIPSASGERPDEATLILQDEATTSNTPVFSVSPFGLVDLVRMVLVLACVVGVIYFVFYLLKRASKGRIGSSDTIRVLGSQSLPGNRSMYLVEVGSQIFLVGAGGDSVSLISEITDTETVDALILRGGEENDSGRKSFGELISGILRGSSGNSLDFMRGQREKLQRLGND